MRRKGGPKTSRSNLTAQQFQASHHVVIYSTTRGRPVEYGQNLADAESHTGRQGHGSALEARLYGLPSRFAEWLGHRFDGSALSGYARRER
jgi:hypothetical protein